MNRFYQRLLPHLVVAASLAAATDVERRKLQLEAFHRALPERGPLHVADRARRAERQRLGYQAFLALRQPETVGDHRRVKAAEVKRTRKGVARRGAACSGGWVNASRRAFGPELVAA